MQALSGVFNNQISRRDAAAGRNSQYGARAVEEQNNFLTNSLPNYRTGLATMYSDLTGNANKNASMAIPGSSGTAGVQPYAAGTATANNTDAAKWAGVYDALGSIFK